MLIWLISHHDRFTIFGAGEIVPEDKVTVRCSFCGKSQHEVKQLIAGPAVSICDECVDLCATVIEEKRDEDAAALRVRSDA